MFTLKIKTSKSQIYCLVVVPCSRVMQQVTMKRQGGNELSLHNEVMAMNNQVLTKWMVTLNPKPYSTNDMSWLHSIVRMGQDGNILRW
jgi:hypothetical protein